MNRRTFLIASLAVLIIPTVVVVASTKDELKAKFQKRYPQLRELKKAGTIGETSDGYVDYVKKKDPKAAPVVEDENHDRKELYGILAKETSTTEKEVAEHAAKRNFEHLQPGEYYKDADGKWTKKS